MTVLLRKGAHNAAYAEIKFWRGISRSNAMPILPGSFLGEVVNAKA